MSKENFDIKEAGYNTVLKMIEEADRKYEQVKKEWIKIAKQVNENVEKDRLNNMTTGEAIYNICKKVDDNKIEVVKALKSVLKRIESDIDTSNVDQIDIEKDEIVTMFNKEGEQKTALKYTYAYYAYLEQGFKEEC